MTALGCAECSLSPLEVASGGALERIGSLRGHRPGGSEPPRRVLESLIERAMSQGPVSVSFSGGRDSSLVMALACHVARRRGLPLPTAITMAHGSPTSQEREWQELVLRHLGVKDWVILDLGDSMDVLGPAATSLLRVTGVLAPPNAYLHLPVAEAAGEGTVLTGVGGDEIFGNPGERVARVIYGRQPPSPRDALSVALAASPRPIRRRWRIHRPSGSPGGWLTKEAQRQVLMHWAEADTAARARWDSTALAYARSRYLALGDHALRAVGRSHGVEILSPLSNLDFIVAFAAHAGPAGPESRTESMRLLAHDLLPERVLARSTKATFEALVWGPTFRQFATAAAIDLLSPDVRSLIRPQALLEEWSAESPHMATMLLIQHAWLRTPPPSESL